jgi:hypothetical protein
MMWRFGEPLLMAISGDASRKTARSGKLQPMFERVRERRKRRAIRAATRLMSQGEEVSAVLGAGKEENAFLGADVSMVVTDQTVILLRRSSLTLRRGNPRVYRRSAIVLEEWRPRSHWSRLRLRTPDEVVNLRVDRVHRPEAAFIACMFPPA